MTFVKRFLVALVMTFSMAAMTTYSSSASAKGIEVTGKEAAGRVLEALNAAKAGAESATSERLAAIVTDARQASKLISVGALASQVQFAWDGLRIAKKHYKYAEKAAKCGCDYKGASEAEHRTLGAAQVVKSIADFEAIEAAVL